MSVTAIIGKVDAVRLGFKFFKTFLSCLYDLSGYEPLKCNARKAYGLRWPSISYNYLT